MEIKGNPSHESRGASLVQGLAVDEERRAGEGEEDRIALLFEINRINNFATKGCAVTCHGPTGAPVKDFKFATATAAKKAPCGTGRSPAPPLTITPTTPG